jgi:hypothetical protein
MSENTFAYVGLGFVTLAGLAALFGQSLVNKLVSSKDSSSSVNSSDLSTRSAPSIVVNATPAEMGSDGIARVPDIPRAGGRRTRRKKSKKRRKSTKRANPSV